MQELVRDLMDMQRRVALLESLDRGKQFTAATAFPATPQTDQIIYRTDRDLLYFYDGTRWLTMQEYQCELIADDSATQHTFIPAAAAAGGAYRLGTTRNDYQLYLTRADITYYCAAPNDGSNYSTFTFYDSSGTTIWTFNTSADAANTNIHKGTNSLTQPGATIIYLYWTISARTGTPGDVYPRMPVIFCRLIG